MALANLADHILEPVFREMSNRASVPGQVSRSMVLKFHEVMAIAGYGERRYI